MGAFQTYNIPVICLPTIKQVVSHTNSPLCWVHAIEPILIKAMLHNVASFILCLHICPADCSMLPSSGLFWFLGLNKPNMFHTLIPYKVDTLSILANKDLPTLEKLYWHWSESDVSVSLAEPVLCCFGLSPCPSSEPAQLFCAIWGVTPSTIIVCCLQMKVEMEKLPAIKPKQLYRCDISEGT